MEKNLPEVNILRGLHLLGLNGKGTVTLMIIILKGNAIKAFQENTKIFWAFSKKQTASQNTAQFFPFQKIAQKMRRTQ